MADELVLKLKVETADGGQKLEDVNQQMDKIKKNAKETNDTFSIGDTKVGKLFKTFSDGAKTGVSAMSTLKGAIAATGIGLLLIAIKGVVDYFKNTKEGADQLAVVMKVLGSVIREGPIVVLKALKIPLDVVVGYFRTLFSVISNTIGVISGKVGITEALKNVANEFNNNVKKVKEDTVALVENGKQAVERAKQAAVLAKMIDAANDNERETLLKKQKLETEISEAKAAAAESDVKAVEKQKLYNTALQKEGELYQINLKQAQARLDIADKEIANGDRSEEALQAQAEAQVNLEAVKTNYTQSTIRLNKQIGASDKQLAADQKKINDDAKKNAQEIQDIKDEAVLASLQGYEKELTAIDQKYAKEYALAEGNAEKQTALDEKHIADVIALQAKQDAELKKAEDEMTAKLKEVEDQRIKDKEEADAKALENHKKALSIAIDMEMQNNQAKLDLGEISTKEFLDKQEELELEAAENEITNTEELEAKKEEIRNAYRIKRKISEEDLEKAIKEAAFVVAQAGADAIFAVKQNNLNKQKEAELGNKNLTEAQKEAINRKYADKQKKMDLAQAIINTALAVGKALATTPFPLNIVMAALAAALGGIQIATIAKTKYYKTGGILQGKSHAQGGIALGNGNYAEGGEGLISAANMKNPLIADSVVKLSTQTVAPTAPVQQPITAQDIIDGVSGVLKSVPIVMTEHQVTQAQTNVQIREGRFSVV